MADNVRASDVVGSSGPVFKSEDDGVAQWLISKLAWGLAGVRNLIGSGADALPIQDGGNSITVDGTVTATGPLTDTQLRASAVPISVATLPLPSTAATAANQTTGNTSLSNIDGKLPSALVSDRLKVDGSGVTQPISATTLPLPTLASVASQQGADVVDFSTLQKYTLGSTAQNLTQTIDGRLRVATDELQSKIDRQLQEMQVLMAIEHSYRSLMVSEQSISNRYGFEMR